VAVGVGVGVAVGEEVGVGDALGVGIGDALDVGLGEGDAVALAAGAGEEPPPPGATTEGTKVHLNPTAANKADANMTLDRRPPLFLPISNSSSPFAQRRCSRKPSAQIRRFHEMSPVYVKGGSSSDEENGVRNHPMRGDGNYVENRRVFWLTAKTLAPSHPGDPRTVASARA
jgi:hypothetical protein